MTRVRLPVPRRDRRCYPRDPINDVCGIFGIVNPREQAVGSEAARRCLQLLAERGPDDEGWYETEHVMLGHRRLSIMDLSAAGRQPMSNEDGRLWLTFNGEIYRYWELRAELERLGHCFRSATDTEVILHGYEEWGSGVLQRIHGMFAFGLWDERSRELLLARDRLGKKPLFWARKGDALAFSSLVRPLVMAGIARPQVDRAKLREFLFHNFVPGPETIFRGVELLPAGSWLRYRSGRVDRGRYWSLADAELRNEVRDSQAEFEQILDEATRVRLVSDAPVGVFLSGGLDSSSVAALASRVVGGPVRTFTVGFEEASYDEREKARGVARRLGSEHHEVLCRPDDVPELLPRLAASADHLLADQSLVPLARLATEAKRSVKVVLTGDGGDELLAGYATYRALQVASAYIGLVPRGLRARLPALAARLPVSTDKMASTMLLQRFLNATAGDLARAHASWRSIWSHDEISALLADREAAPEWESCARYMETREDWNLVQRAVYADTSGWLVDSILAKVDRAAMLTGLEPRSPLLDTGLMQFAFGTLLREPRNTSKRPLRRLARGLLGPDLAAAKKEGFQTPFAHWFAGPLRAYVRDAIATLCERMEGVFDEQVMERIEAEHASGVRNHDLKLWSMVALAEWSKLYPDLQLHAEG